MLERLRTVLGRSRTDTAPAATERTSEVVHAPAEPDTRLARDLVREELQTAEAAFWTQWDDEADLDASIEALTAWHGWRTALARLEAPTDPDRLTFQVDSLALQDCYQVLFADSETESISYLTGLAFENVRTLNRCLELDHAVQSATRAEADPDAAFEVLATLEANGHQLHGHCHNQPGTGVESTAPSPTDRAYQHRLEATGYEVVGIIMTRDGWVRFFSNDLPFRVEVYGNHVNQTNEHVFRLEKTARKPNSLNIEA